MGELNLAHIWIRFLILLQRSGINEIWWKLVDSFKEADDFGKKQTTLPRHFLNLHLDTKANTCWLSSVKINMIPGEMYFSWNYKITGITILNVGMVFIRAWIKVNGFAKHIVLFS